MLCISRNFQTSDNLLIFPWINNLLVLIFLFPPTPLKITTVGSHYFWWKQVMVLGCDGERIRLRLNGHTGRRGESIQWLRPGRTLKNMLNICFKPNIVLDYMELTLNLFKWRCILYMSKGLEIAIIVIINNNLPFLSMALKYINILTYYAMNYSDGSPQFMLTLQTGL